MKAFQIKVNGRLLDYRLGHDVNLEKFSRLLELKGYRVEKLWQEKRHAVGIIEKSNKKLFVKLATSKGMNYTTKNEYVWNENFFKIHASKNLKFIVPKNVVSGFFNDYFYIISEFQKGKKLAERPNPGYEAPDFRNHIEGIIEFSKLIQSKEIPCLNPDGEIKYANFHERFISRTYGWYEEIDKSVKDKYRLEKLLNIVKEDTKKLEGKSRHGDFTPWHIFVTPNKKLFLFDGERALSEDVENYDICFFIQRIYSVLENKKLALEMLQALNKQGYDFNKLKVVLASRAIGGFLDRSLHEKPDYRLDSEFKKLVLGL